MTIEIGLALLALLTAVGSVARVMFSTEVKAEHLAAANTSTEKKIETLTGKSQAQDMLISDAAASHAGLSARVDAIAATLAMKASAESVVALKESVESLRRDIHDGFARTEKLIQHATPRRNDNRE
jgi:hypothetical protein